MSCRYHRLVMDEKAKVIDFFAAFSIISNQSSYLASVRCCSIHHSPGECISFRFIWFRFDSIRLFVCHLRILEPMAWHRCSCTSSVSLFAHALRNIRRSICAKIIVRRHQGEYRRIFVLSFHSFVAIDSLNVFVIQMNGDDWIDQLFVTFLVMWIKIQVPQLMRTFATAKHLQYYL